MEVEIATKRTLEEQYGDDLRLQTLIQPSDCVSMIRRGDSYSPARPGRLRNSLLTAVGFLELANAGDFAANVWNQVPLPRYAVVFMVIGGLVAFSMSYFAFRDTRLSWQNMLLLREERHYLQKQKALHTERQACHPQPRCLLGC